MICDVCKKEITNPCELWHGELWQINGAVIGEYIKIQGHKTCCEAVNNLVVIPNRLRIMKC